MAAVPDLDRPWELSDPLRDRTLIPYTDQDTAWAVREAVTTLVTLRAPAWLGDPGPVISVLVSLTGEAEGCLFDAVADARDAHYSWAQITSRLAATDAAGVRRLYGPYVRWRRGAGAGGDVQ